jgi:hypothetical protein
MKQIEPLKIVELTENESIKTGGDFGALLFAVFGGVGICLAAFQIGYTIGKAIF